MALVLTEQSTADLAVVTLNNPGRLNALSMEMVSQLREALDALAESKSRVVILTGAGRGFCSGLDLSEPAVAPTAQGPQAECARRSSSPRWCRRSWRCPNR